ncbi:MAG: M3 family oligoendopeptidase [Ignavibacteria bacterium]|nr:M3 family oligoendopeptidase [Ignavibacteria bacterium]
MPQQFSELKYERLILSDIESACNEAKKVIAQATDSWLVIDAIHKWNEMRMHVMTMVNLAEVNYSLDVSNQGHKAEKHFYDVNSPTITEWNVEVEKVILASPFRKEVAEEFGEIFLKIIENSLRTFSPEIKELMVEEANLNNSYNEITASGIIELDGMEYNLSTIGAVVVETNRDRRRRATEASYTFLGNHAQELDTIYDKLVKIRVEKARRLGFQSYTELRYAEMGRVDYTPKDVEVFRNKVLEYVVPLSVSIREAQRKRLGLDTLTIYDEKLDFADGNPNVEGEYDFIVGAAEKMYSELSPETNEFFSALSGARLMDLKSRDNKAVGGYCTSFPEYRLPFIFANFNGTTHDVEVLTHEAGHAFQAYRSKNLMVPEYLWPTTEACEIHSMGMEFITWPWMKYFFGDQTEKFKFYHLSGAIKFLPYACAVDEFQHWVYANPEAGPTARCRRWNEMEKKYLPWRDASEIPEAGEGRQWQFQKHIYESPFYYIDYALAQTCALQIWKKSIEDKENAFKEYLKICDVGGSQSFLQIVETGNLSSPFLEKTLQDVFGGAMLWLRANYPQYIG